MRRKLPPYAKRIGDRRDIRLFVGNENAWSRARAFDNHPRAAAVVLPDPNPEAYNWTCLRGCEVLVCQVDTFPLQALQRLGELLVQAGADKVVVLYISTEGIRQAGFTAGYDLPCEPQEPVRW